MNGDDFLTLVWRHRVPDGHAVGRQVQAVSAREWTILRERIRKRHSVMPHASASWLRENVRARSPVAGAGVILDALQGHSIPCFTPQPSHLGLE